MIKHLRLGLIILSTSLLSHNIAAGQTLWRNAVVGQGLIALQHQFPAAVAPKEPQVLSAGEVEGLRLNGVELGGVPVQVHFFLRDARLSSVQLSAPFLKPGQSDSNLAFARRVARMITADGGPPYNCVDDRFAAIGRYECKWLRGDVTIHVSYLDVSGQAPFFYLAYRRADDPAFDS